VAESELMTEDTLLRRVQGATSCKFRTELEVNKVVKGRLVKVVLCCES
jgi:hypothetical protein